MEPEVIEVKQTGSLRPILIFSIQATNAFEVNMKRGSDGTQPVRYQTIYEKFARFDADKTYAIYAPQQPHQYDKALRGNKRGVLLPTYVSRINIHWRKTTKMDIGKKIFKFITGLAGAETDLTTDVRELGGYPFVQKYKSWDDFRRSQKDEYEEFKKYRK